jgi:hypothetical protein
MTVFDDINSKDIDEFVYWLDEVGMHDCSLWVKWWDDNYCNKCKPEVVDDPETGGQFCNAYCELHGNCKYFKDLDDIPSIKQIIKMWLESEYEYGV